MANTLSVASRERASLAAHARASDTQTRAGLLETLAIAWDFMFNKPSNTRPSGTIPVQQLSREQLLGAPDHTLYRLGHSTVLLKLAGAFWLTDPVFSKRASPLQWIGPKRFHQPPISIADLPPIKAVILSHDHYDHLDRAAVLELAAKTEYFLAPLGVGDLLIKWGVPAAKVHQLDWWQGLEIEGIRLTATPSQHFSGRGLFDGNQTLWASWVIQSPTQRIFFSGDTGYFAGFRQIGERFGPFDITLLETGAYNENWPTVHMQPEQTLQAHKDLQGRWLVPIHNGTFDLSLHAWHEPFDRIVSLAAEHGIPVSVPQMGEALSLAWPHSGMNWWQRVDSQTSEQPGGCKWAGCRLAIGKQ